MKQDAISTVANVRRAIHADADEVPFDDVRLGSASDVKNVNAGSSVAADHVLFIRARSTDLVVVGIADDQNAARRIAERGVPRRRCSDVVALHRHVARREQQDSTCTVVRDDIPIRRVRSANRHAVGTGHIDAVYGVAAPRRSIRIEPDVVAFDHRVGRRVQRDAVTQELIDRQPSDCRPTAARDEPQAIDPARTASVEYDDRRRAEINVGRAIDDHGVVDFRQSRCQADGVCSASQCFTNLEVNLVRRGPVRRGIGGRDCFP